MWPQDADALVLAQEELALASPEPWVPPDGVALVGGCWVCFPRGLTGPGNRGDPAWAAVRGDPQRAAHRQFPYLARRHTAQGRNH